jgi:anti-sigma factor RsiW
MDCTRYREQVNHFIDGELELRPQAELFRHLADCADCQSLIDGLVRIKEGVRNERIPYPQELDDALLGEILARVPGAADAVKTVRRQEGLWGRRVVVPLHFAVSFAVIVIILALMLGRSMFSPSGSPPVYTDATGGFARPQAVIFVYGMPPVEVLGSTVVKTSTDLDRFNH